MGGDPLLASGSIDALTVLIIVIKVAVAFVLLLVGVMLMIWFERKLIGDMQNRIGPNRAGPWGILQTLADGVKLFFKEEILPSKADRRVFLLAPYLSLIPAMLAFAVVPIGGNFANGGDGTVEIFGRETFLQVADPPVGILWFLAMGSLAVYGVMLAGWASGSKYPLIGSVRATAQMVSYEAALGLTVGTVILVAGALSTNQIVVEQGPWAWNLWITGVVPAVIFLIAGTAELNRPPFDLVEAEQELVGGFHTEYSSVRFALFYLAEFMNTITMAAIIVTLFLGGPLGPAPIGPAWVWSLVWFFLKLFVLLFVFVWFRATLPRFRYDQLMDLGWKVLIPLSLGWFLLVALIRTANDNGWNVPLATAGGFVALVVGWALLALAVRTAARQRDVEELGV